MVIIRIKRIHRVLERKKLLFLEGFNNGLTPSGLYVLKDRKGKTYRCNVRLIKINLSSEVKIRNSQRLKEQFIDLTAMTFPYFAIQIVLC